MGTATSADGTTIAYEAYGDGPAVIVVGGATNTKEAWAELCQALATDGFTGVTYDRRGRGGSGGTRPYEVEREVEDLAAVIEAVGAPVGDPAGVHAVSSGGALAYRAAAAGVPIRTLSVLETPYRVGDHPTPPADYIETLQELYDLDDPQSMLEYFFLAGVGLPPEAVDAITYGPDFDALLGVGLTVLYDALCLGSSEAVLPADLLATVSTPVPSIASTGSPAFLVDAARAAGDAVPDGTFVQLSGDFHSVPTATLVPELAAHHRA
ncbi:alpha/beta fold hydrolase [Nocardioides mangrovicus]|uniref:Alpha/beta fold hydrolase n=1 Tax=Nocardioides mangrovicus TaxID=2478913 RepID=A0A3L8NY87_9ACTN|nr:alpha/beta fold hydrolase [Nocardioides mangrovicus]RLV47801.1 alpha/beta fold hydrolase [Nocardioides mangrovicus]